MYLEESCDGISSQGNVSTIGETCHVNVYMGPWYMFK